MADKIGLQIIGWMFAGITVAVMLIATILVHDTIANPSASDGRAGRRFDLSGQATDSFAPSRTVHRTTYGNDKRIVLLGRPKAELETLR